MHETELKKLHISVRYLCRIQKGKTAIGLHVEGEKSNRFDKPLNIIFTHEQNLYTSLILIH